MITDDGLEEVAEIMNATGTVFTHIAVGTGTTTASAADTTLETEISRAALTKTKGGARKFRYRRTLGVGDDNGNTLSEVGAFNAGAAGDMYNHTIFTGIAKDNTFALRIEIETEVKEE